LSNVLNFNITVPGRDPSKILPRPTGWKTLV